MNFSINHSKQKDLELVELIDQTNQARVAILPAAGALLQQFALPVQGIDFNVIDHYPDNATLQKELATSFKGSKLSPFACRLKDGKYRWAGKSYEFKNKFPDGTAIHGLLYNKAFSVVERKEGANSAAVLLRYDYNRDDDQYPFQYRCEVRYELSGDHTLDIETRITNTGSEPIPMADGWHPYFALGGKIDEWVMFFNAEAIVEFDQQLIPTGKLLPYDQFNLPRKIGDTRLDNCFLLKSSRDLAVCEIYNPNNKLKLSFYPDASYPYLQIYTPPHRNSIAIENLSAAPDAFNNKMGLIRLEAGQHQSFRVRLDLSIV